MSIQYRLAIYGGIDGDDDEDEEERDSHHGDGECDDDVPPGVVRGSRFYDGGEIGGRGCGGWFHGQWDAQPPPRAL